MYPTNRALLRNAILRGGSVCGHVIEGVQFGNDLWNLDGGKLAHFEFGAKTGVFAFGVVEDVDAKFGRHVEAVVGADVDAHFARRARFPDDTDASVVVARHEEPGFHVLETFVGILNGLRLPQGGFEVGGDSVGCEFLSADVVHRGGRSCTGAASSIEELGWDVLW